MSKYVWGKRVWHIDSGKKLVDLKIGKRELAHKKLHTMKCGVKILSGSPVTDRPASNRLKGSICSACRG